MKKHLCVTHPYYTNMKYCEGCGTLCTGFNHKDNCPSWISMTEGETKTNQVLEDGALKDIQKTLKLVSNALDIAIRESKKIAMDSACQQAIVNMTLAEFRLKKLIQKYGQDDDVSPHNPMSTGST